MDAALALLAVAADPQATAARLAELREAQALVDNARNEANLAENRAKEALAEADAKFKDAVSTLATIRDEQEVLNVASKNISERSSRLEAAEKEFEQYKSDREADLGHREAAVEAREHEIELREVACHELETELAKREAEQAAREERLRAALG